MALSLTEQYSFAEPMGQAQFWAPRGALLFQGHLSVLSGLSSITAGLTCWLVAPRITLPSAAGLLVFEVVSYVLSGAFCLLCDCSQESKFNLCNYILVRIRSTSLQIPLLSQKKTWMG